MGVCSYHKTCEEIVRARRYVSLREAVWHAYSGTVRKHMCLLKKSVIRHLVLYSLANVFRINHLRFDEKDSVNERESVIIRRHMEYFCPVVNEITLQEEVFRLTGKCLFRAYLKCDSFGTRPKKMRISQRLFIRF